MTIKLLQLEHVTPELQHQLTELYQQLNAEINQLSLKTIFEAADKIDVVCCMEENQLIGIAMMANYKVVSVIRVWWKM